MFNWSQCFPDVAVSLLSAAVVARTGSQASMMGLGGTAALGGALFIFLWRVGAGERAVTPEKTTGSGPSLGSGGQCC